MLKTIEQIKTKLQEYKNGKVLDKQTITPIDFVNETIIPIIKRTELPKEMVNNDKFRQEDQKSVIIDIENAIIKAYFDKRSGFKKYIEETPYNKMLLWGVMFESLREVLIGETLKQYPRTIKKINTKQYTELPKRYRGIFKKDDKHPNLYTAVLKSKEEKFAVAHNLEFDILNKKIRDLISLLYKEELLDTYKDTIDSDYDPKDESYWKNYQVYRRYGQYANTDPAKSDFVSDKQMNAIIELQKIFTKTASEVYVTKTKHGNTEIWNEMQDEQSRNHIFWRAQKLTRTANQLVVSTRKASEFCGERQIRQATEHYNRVKNDVMYQLRRKTSVRIK